RELAKLARPGDFFDFTRYRPTTKFVNEQRVNTAPNSTVSYAQRPDGPDLLFFHIMEPHAAAEEYIKSILELIKMLGVRRYCRVGASYGAVPHTRPLLVSQSIGGMQVDRKTGELVSRRGRYQGPTSIMNLVTEGIAQAGIETMSLSVRLPYYARLEEDFTGAAQLLGVISEVYNLPTMLVDTMSFDKSRGDEQYRRISAEIEKYPDVKSLIEHLEEDYDAQSASPSAINEPAPLSPEIERFLKDINEQLTGA
ncbi:MAG: putative ATP-dependent carboligase, ATP-grasp superfamily, partial [Dehalococcoidia bacterium]|nr:putative ATP-dependent carboligase, ATP-grasp superfamily [Dehalococcoidia bacterium]